MADTYQHVLMIDDDEDDGEIFVAALNIVSNDITCTVLHDASTALTRLSLKEIAPDIIFLDLNMPIMNGQQFLLEVKKSQALRNIPVVIFSTTTHSPTIAMVKELGAQDFITKPNNFDDLVTILSAFFNKSLLNN